MSTGEDVLIILPVRETVLFPGVVLPIAITGKASLAAAQEAVRTQRRVGLLLQNDPTVEDPSLDALHRVGTCASIVRFITAPDGSHLFPAFPYTSYQRMQLTDVRDLFAYLKTLPPVAGRTRRHDLAFPFNVRRLVGVWKLLFFHGGPFAPDPTKSAQVNRGAYLVNGPGHCAECHSPRNFLGAVVESQRFAGGPAPDGKGWVPNITPAGLQHQDSPWSARDIAAFLTDGMTPSGDYAGGAMVDVIRNLEQIDAADREAVAAYVYSLPAREGPKPPLKSLRKP